MGKSRSENCVVEALIIK